MSDTGQTGCAGRQKVVQCKSSFTARIFEKYRQLLAETKDEDQRRQLEKLLAEEVAREPLVLKPRGDR